MEKILVEIYFAENNYSAHIPLLQGCVSTGMTIEELKLNITEAVQFHLEGMMEDGDEIPVEFRNEYKLKFEPLF
jgi:predicted RNase H-like HicB family nuclease